MDQNNFRKRGKQMISYVCNYWENIDKRRVFPKVEPGYLEPLLPKAAPETGEDWDSILKDVEEKIMPGITHWHHPQFHAYFPNGNAPPSILADILSAAIGAVGFSWAASPAATELETIMLDWYGKALDLPSEFLFFSEGSKGGGVLQSSASDCVLVCMLAARSAAIKYLMKIAGDGDGIPSEYLPQLVVYCSRESHSSVEKAAMISMMRLQTIDIDEHGSINTVELSQQIERDRKKGLHPAFIACTVGTTGTCAFDNLAEVGKIAKSLPECWFHVDGAYGGNSFICPEMRGPMKGIKYADSFGVNCNKLLLISFDCSCLWVKDRFALTSALNVDPVYLQHENSKVGIDYRHWTIQLSRRFRSLKLWFTMRLYGIRGLQEYIRNHCRLGKYFEELVRKDDRFQICNEVKLGLVCFKLKGDDKLNQDFLALINHSGELHMIPTQFKGEYILRFCVVYPYATHEHIDRSWQIIQKHADALQLPSNKPLEGMRGGTCRRLSFTRSVSRELYEKRISKKNLYDGAIPIPVISAE